MKEVILNKDNLKVKDIDEKTVRARAIIINSKEEVLMSFSNGLNHYEFPGGHLEKGETLQVALKREIKEETGLILNTQNLSPFFSIKYFCKDYHGSGKNRLVEIHYFEVKTDELYDLSKAEFDTNEIIENYECRYIPLNSLKQIIIDNMMTTKENNSSLSDMLMVINEYKNMKGLDT